MRRRRRSPSYDNRNKNNNFLPNSNLGKSNNANSTSSPNSNSDDSLNNINNGEVLEPDDRNFLSLNITNKTKFKNKNNDKFYLENKTNTVNNDCNGTTCTQTHTLDIPKIISVPKPSIQTTQTNILSTDTNNSTFSSIFSSTSVNTLSVSNSPSSLPNVFGTTPTNESKRLHLLSSSLKNLSNPSSSRSNSANGKKVNHNTDNGSTTQPKGQLFLKRYVNDSNSKEGINIDDMITKLIKLNEFTSAPKKSCKRNGNNSGSGSYKSNFPIHTWEIQLICSHVRELFLSQPTLLKLQSPIKIVGDIHGQFNDLLRIFKLSGLPNETNYLFLGDYIDRGKQSLETILLLFCYKLKYKDNFFMLRGNHESANITKMYGFYDECKRRKSSKIWKNFIDVFNCLPIAAIIQDKIFCVHGGISPDLSNLKQINNIVRPTDIPDEGLVTDLLWSDPHPSISDWSDNDRGVSYTFSKQNVLDFCNKFKFDLIIRGHMVVEDGYEFFAKKKLVTIFSAPNYCGQFGNWGAVLSISTGLICSFELLKPHSLTKRKY